jgi:hypothetical protein
MVTSALLMRGDIEATGQSKIHSSRRDRKTKAIAEALAMLADAHPELVPHRPRPVRETDEGLWEMRENRGLRPRQPPGPRRVAPIPHRLSIYPPGETLSKF